MKFKIMKKTGQFETVKEQQEIDGVVKKVDVKKEILEEVKTFEEEESKYAHLLYRARLDVEIHNRDNPDELWMIQEVAE